MRKQRKDRDTNKDQSVNNNNVTPDNNVIPKNTATEAEETHQNKYWLLSPLSRETPILLSDELQRTAWLLFEGDSVAVDVVITVGKKKLRMIMEKGKTGGLWMKYEPIRGMKLKRHNLGELMASTKIVTTDHKAKKNKTYISYQLILVTKVVEQMDDECWTHPIFDLSPEDKAFVDSLCPDQPGANKSSLNSVKTLNSVNSALFGSSDVNRSGGANTTNTGERTNERAGNVKIKWTKETMDRVFQIASNASPFLSVFRQGEEIDGGQVESPIANVLFRNRVSLAKLTLRFLQVVPQCPSYFRRLRERTLGSDAPSPHLAHTSILLENGWLVTKCVIPHSGIADAAQADSRRRYDQHILEVPFAFNAWVSLYTSLVASSRSGIFHPIPMKRLWDCAGSDEKLKSACMWSSIACFVNVHDLMCEALKDKSKSLYQWSSNSQLYYPSLISFFLEYSSESLSTSGEDLDVNHSKRLDRLGSMGTVDAKIINPATKKALFRHRLLPSEMIDCHRATYSVIDWSMKIEDKNVNEESNNVIIDTESIIDPEYIGLHLIVPLFSLRTNQRPLAVIGMMRSGIQEVSSNDDIGVFEPLPLEKLRVTTTSFGYDHDKENYGKYNACFHKQAGRIVMTTFCNDVCVHLVHDRLKLCSVFGSVGMKQKKSFGIIRGCFRFPQVSLLQKMGHRYVFSQINDFMRYSAELNSNSNHRVDRMSLWISKTDELFRKGTANELRLIEKRSQPPLPMNIMCGPWLKPLEKKSDIPDVYVPNMLIDVRWLIFLCRSMNGWTGTPERRARILRSFFQRCIWSGFLFDCETRKSTEHEHEGNTSRPVQSTHLVFRSLPKVMFDKYKHEVSALYDWVEENRVHEIGWHNMGKGAEKEMITTRKRRREEQLAEKKEKNKKKPRQTKSKTKTKGKKQGVNK